MRRKFLASVALGLALAAPGAAAAVNHAQADCRLLNYMEDTATGQDVYVGAAGGYVASPTPGEAVSIRCIVRVNGVHVASTPTGSGTNVAATLGEIVYTATDTDDVDLCWEITAGSESSTTCADTLNIQVFPQELADLFNANVTQPAQDVGGGCLTIVNEGTCNSGVCLINTAGATCDGGFCVVNTGWCGAGCIAGVNLGTCGRPPAGRVDPR